MDQLVDKSNLLKRPIRTILGLVALPFVFAYDRFILKRPSVPSEFWQFIKALNERGLKGPLEMQNLEIPGIVASATISLNPNPDNFQVVNIFKFDSEATCEDKLEEVKTNPLMSHGMKRGPYLMSCTFIQEDNKLGDKVKEAFSSFKLPPDPTT